MDTGFLVPNLKSEFCLHIHSHFYFYVLIAIESSLVYIQTLIVVRQKMKIAGTQEHEASSLLKPGEDKESMVKKSSSIMF